MQNMFLLVSVFILCFLANSRSFSEKPSDLEGFSLLVLFSSEFPDQAEPTTHHFPLSSA